MKKVFVAHLLILAQLGAPAFGAPTDLDSQCAPFRMDDPGGSMEHVKVRDQAQLGICFAETGAQLVDAIRFSRNGDTDYGNQTSGPAIASGIGAERGVNTFKRGGQACWALDHVQKRGACDQRALEDRFLPGLAEGVLASANLSIHSRTLSASSSANSLCKGEPYLPVEASAFPGEKLATALLDNGLDLKKANADLTRACRFTNPLEGKPLSCSSFPGDRRVEPSTREYREKFHELMNRPKALPIEIHFCAKMLKTPSASLMRVWSRNPSVENCEPHASLVIGRRQVGGRCQFLVRNSWGTDCNVYPESIRANCEEGRGNIWVDAESLMQNTLGLVPPPSI